MPGDPMRRRRRKQLAAELGAATVDPAEAAALRAKTDEELELEAIELRMPPWARAGGPTALEHLSDDELVALYRAEIDAQLAALPTKTDRVLAAQLRLEGVEGRARGPIAAGIMAEQVRRGLRPPEPRPEPVIVPVPVIEPHAVVLDEPRAPKVVVEETPREKFDREQRERIAAAVEDARADGARQAAETLRLRDVQMGTGYEGPMFGSEPT